MKTLPQFAYLAPQSVTEVVQLLDTYGNKAKLLAGGTDLIPLMKDRVLTPTAIIDIKRLAGISHIEWNTEEGLKIGALTTITEIFKSSLIKEKYPSLHKAAESFGTTQVRNMATIGGNICRSSPSADTIPPLLASNARVKLVGTKGERVVALEAFFTGPGTNVARNEMLVEIIVPPMGDGYGMSYKKIARTAEDLAKINCAVTVGVENGVCNDMRIALGAVAPTAVRAKNVESALVGKVLTEPTVASACVLIPKDISPITDCRSQADYRIRISQVLIKRMVIEAAASAEER